ncbi:MAG: hypothetical protein NZ895_01580 [Archaeoglobaceae archaeon]|nr:hypothetical protein [Archaeoglobaceae archaeon]MCX8151626.1 hypothetical protein [Archaeoglobaceae archaeon]MDW8013096.1 hypothetical protein [Archaeoglobaceae archaeon]
MNCPRCKREEVDLRYITWNGFEARRCRICGLYFYVKGSSLILSVVEKSEEEE